MKIRVIYPFATDFVAPVPGDELDVPEYLALDWANAHYVEIIPEEEGEEEEEIVPLVAPVEPPVPPSPSDNPEPPKPPRPRGTSRRANT